MSGRTYVIIGNTCTWTYALTRAGGGGLNRFENCVRSAPPHAIVSRVFLPSRIHVLGWHRFGHPPHPATMRSSLFLWAACTARVSATWVCGGDVEITKSWDDKNIDGHCVGDSHPTAARTHHLHVARPLLALHSHKTPRAKSPLHACTLLCMHAPSAGEYEGAEFMPGDRVPLAWSTWPLGSAPARLLRLLMAALGNLALTGRRAGPRSAQPLFQQAWSAWPVSQLRTRPRPVARLQRPSVRGPAARGQARGPACAALVA